MARNDTHVYYTSHLKSEDHRSAFWSGVTQERNRLVPDLIAENRRLRTALVDIVQSVFEREPRDIARRALVGDE